MSIPKGVWSEVVTGPSVAAATDPFANKCLVDRDKTGGNFSDSVAHV